jgi:hypothetical protein
VKTILAWHFCSGWKLRDGRELVVGKTYLHNGPLEMCKVGLHASVRAIDALSYARGNVVCRVACGGEVQHDKNKLVCTVRRVIAAADCESILREYACMMAEAALMIAGQDDDRCWAAVGAARLWNAGQITASDLDAAWAAARAVARAAAGAAAGAAAWAAAEAAARDEQNAVLEDLLKDALRCK